MAECPICGHSLIAKFFLVGKYQYYRCENCGSLFIDPEVIARIDRGENLVSYSADYWKAETVAARERSYGAALARVAEVFLYARKPIERFIDLGTGPGYLLDALATYLPCSSSKFHGIEKFPPEQYSSHKNYHVGALDDLNMKFDAGSCIEVIEHLTPSILKEMISQLATRSTENSVYIFNTGLPDYVLNEDPGYLDPLVRGHIVSYSLAGLALMANPLGFAVKPIPGKTWAFLLEYTNDKHENEEVIDRIWTANPKNVETLKDPIMGDVLYLLGLETARAYR